MSDFNAGLEAAAKLAETVAEANLGPFSLNMLDQATVGSSVAQSIANKIRALRRPDAPDAGREALDRLLEYSRGEKINKAHIVRAIAAARQALGGER